MTQIVEQVESEPVEGALLSPQQVARRLGCSVDQVRDIIRSRSLSAVNISQNPRGQRPRYRVKPEDLERFIAERTLGPVVRRPRRRPAYTREV